MLSLPQLRDPAPADGCGPCTVCCDLIAVSEVLKPYYARCPHLKCLPAEGNEQAGCGIYDGRPRQCADYRCAWHLGYLGPRVDRRPNESGLLFHFEPQDGRWHLAIWEVTPGAARTDRAAFLTQLLLTSKKVRHLALGPLVRVYPYGSDVPVPWAISDRYGFTAPMGSVAMKQENSRLVFAGATRDLLMPK